MPSHQIFYSQTGPKLDPHLGRDLNHLDSHKARLSPRSSGVVVLFHRMRISARRPSNSITHRKDTGRRRASDLPGHASNRPGTGHRWKASGA